MTHSNGFLPFPEIAAPAWVEDTIKETLAFTSLPPKHHKHLESTNLLERFNQ